MKVVFVVLHYMNYDDTLNCVSSIMNLKTTKAKVKVVLIDNCSPDGSGKRLKEIYKNNDCIVVKLLEKNVGFSKANNEGYKIAKNMGADYIIASNNDILIDDKQFVLETLGGEDRAEIVCPDIVNLKGQHQNPLRDKPITAMGATKNALYKIMMLVLLCTPFLCKRICRYEIKRERDWENEYYKNKKFKAGTYNFVPFGAFVIFTKRWVNREDFAFPSSTFMYCEEEFLCKYILKKGYKMQYRTDLKVEHLEGGSVKASTENDIRRLRFRYKKQVVALVKYICFVVKLNIGFKYE